MRIVPLPAPALALALIAALGPLAGCLNDANDVGDLTPPLERASPEELLAFFAAADCDPTRDLEATERCLDEGLRFHFTEMDRAGNPTIPEFIGKAQMLAATDSMFHNAVHIAMSISVEDTLSIGPCDTTSADTCRTYEVDVHLTVQMPPWPGWPDGVTYLIRGLSNITVVRDAANAEQWVIRDIVDRTNELGGAPPPRVRPDVEPTSWGHVLALFF